MIKQWLLVGLLFLIISCLLAGCGVAQEDYDAVVADLDAAQQEIQSLQAELGSTQTELGSTVGELATSQTELESSQTQVTTLLAEKETLIADGETLQADYDELCDENCDIEEELAAVYEVFPARHFDSRAELQDWLRENDVSERPLSDIAEFMYEKALDIQEAALADGYIVSAWIDYSLDEGIFFVLCTAIAGGDIYMWEPENDDILNFSELTDFMSVR